MIITISRNFGAGATSVARIIAERCGYRLVDDDLTWRVARRLNIDYPLVAADEELQRPFLLQLSRQLPGAVVDPGTIPNIDTDISLSETRRTMENEIVNEAKRGEAVIVGRAAGFVLGAQPDLMRVFLHAPTAWRIERVAEWFRYTAKQAKETVQRLDEARAAYVREYYSATLNDARNYDLAIDTSTSGFESAAEAIIYVAALRQSA